MINKSLLLLLSQVLSGGYQVFVVPGNRKSIYAIGTVVLKQFAAIFLDSDFLIFKMGTLQQSHKIIPKIK